MPGQAWPSLPHCWDHVIPCDIQPIRDLHLTLTQEVCSVFCLAECNSLALKLVSLLPSQAKKKVIAAAMGFGPVGWRECGLPHPVPIACVGCGACDIDLLQAIAKLTNGMHVIVENIAELSTFFRRQVKSHLCL